MSKILSRLLLVVGIAGLLIGGNYTYGYLVWSRAEPGEPDLSRMIVYEGRPRGIFISRLDGSDKKEITESLNLGPDDFTWLPRFSPDGSRIVFAVGRFIRGDDKVWDVSVYGYELSTHDMNGLYRFQESAKDLDEYPEIQKSYMRWTENSHVVVLQERRVETAELTRITEKSIDFISKKETQTGPLRLQDPKRADGYEMTQSPGGRWVLDITHTLYGGFFGPVGDDQAIVRPKKSLFKKVVLTNTPYYNPFWLDEDHLIVDGPRDIIVVDIKGSVKARILNARHFDLQPE